VTEDVTHLICWEPIRVDSDVFEWVRNLNSEASVRQPIDDTDDTLVCGDEDVKKMWKRLA